MSNPEVQRNTPNGSPAKSSDTLLKSFRATLNQRWNEFDQATLQEAQAQVNNHILGGFTDAKSQRDKDANFIKAKATFDEAMSALAAIDTDAKLKQTLETPGRLGSTINSLKDYLAKADAQKSYNAVLSHTLADLTGLKAQMTEKVEDKKDAEIAKAATLVVAGTGATLGNEVMKGLSGAVAEGTKAVQQEIASVKKNPGKTIAEFLGFSEDSILSDYREALAEKKAGGFDGIFSGIKLWFYGFMAKLTGFNIAKSLTPEELKLAGLQAPVESTKPEPQKIENKEDLKNSTKNVLYNGAFSGLISFHQQFLMKITQETDKSKNKERVGNVFRYQNMYDLPYEKAQFIYKNYKTTPDNSDLLKEIGVTDPKSSIKPRDIFAAIALMVDDSLASTRTLQKSIEKNKNITLGELLTSSHGDWAIANDFEKIDPTISADPSKIASQVFGNIGARFNIIKEGEGYKFENNETQEQAKKLGIEGTVLAELMVSGININNLQTSEIEKQGLSEQSKLALKKLIDFWKVIKGPLAKDFSFGQESEYINFYNSSSISPISLLKLYLLTGGSPDLSGIASPRKMGIYAIIRESFFDGSPANKAKGAQLFDKAIINMATIWITSPTDIDKYIPKDVQEAMGNIGATVTDTVIDSSWGVASRAWMRLPTEWKVGAGIGITVGIMLIWRLRILKYVGFGVGIGAAAVAALFSTAVYAGLSTEDKKKFPEEEIRKGATQGIEKMIAKTD